jgi:ribosomal protein S18 acetylase RimI-like enzyme
MKEAKDLAITRIRGSDDLHQLAADINSAQWDTANDLDDADYSAESLTNFVADDDRILIVARHQERFVGIASATVLLKPYEQERWMYVDEVDVVADYRKQGAGTALMKELLCIAKINHCAELWLGTEHDNGSALKLYESLEPDDTESFVGFTYRIQIDERPSDQVDSRRQ